MPIILPLEIITSVFSKMPFDSLVQTVAFLKSMFLYFGFFSNPNALFGNQTDGISA